MGILFNMIACWKQTITKSRDDNEWTRWAGSSTRLNCFDIVDLNIGIIKLVYETGHSRNHVEHRKSRGSLY